MTKPKAMSDADWKTKKRQINQEYYAVHKEHWHDSRKTYPEREKVYKRKYREKYREELLSYASDYRKKNREKIRARDRLRDRKRNYQPRTPEQNIVHRHRRRARLSKTAYGLSPSEVRIILGYGCLVCDSQENLTLAHDVPIVRGGGTTLSNCFCLCRSHNSRMSIYTLEEYRPDLIHKRNTQLNNIILEIG